MNILISANCAIHGLFLSYAKFYFSWFVIYIYIYIFLFFKNKNFHIRRKKMKRIWKSIIKKNTAFTIEKKTQKEQKTLISSNKNYCREMKLMPINMHYILDQFDSLYFFLEVCLHWGSVFNFIFFNVNSQICKFFKIPKSRNFYHSNCLYTNFQSISDISLSVSICRICN